MVGSELTEPHGMPCGHGEGEGKHIGMVLAELMRARRKYAVFAERLIAPGEMACADLSLSYHRHMLSYLVEVGDVTATAVLQCEIAEVVEAYAKGDREAALTELAQVGAVVLRMMEFVAAEMAGSTTACRVPMEAPPAGCESEGEPRVESIEPHGVPCEHGEGAE